MATAIVGRGLQLAPNPQVWRVAHNMPVGRRRASGWARARASSEQCGGDGGEAQGASELWKQEAQDLKLQLERTRGELEVRPGRCPGPM